MSDLFSQPNSNMGLVPASNRAGSFSGPLLFLVAVLLILESIPRLLHWPARILSAVAVLWLAYAAFRALRTMKFEPKKVVFSIILIGLLYGAVHFMCHVFITLMSERDKRLSTADTGSLTRQARLGIKSMLAGDSPVEYCKDLGWVHRPGYKWKGHSITEQGLRGTRLYPAAPTDSAKRLICVGDSFTFGYEVADDQTFPYHGEQLRPGTEWINLGICGSGLTQSYLQYRKNGRKFGGKYVVIGFMTDNLKRSVNCFRAFVAPTSPMTPLTKPHAKLTDGKFSIEPNPFQEISDYQELLANEGEELARLRELDYPAWSKQEGSTNPVVRTLLYIMERRNVDRNIDILFDRPQGNGSSFELSKAENPYGRAMWDPESPGFQANVALFDLFYSEVITDGRIPIIVVLPDAEDVEHRSAGQRPLHASLLDYLKVKGYRHFDFLDSLQERYPNKLKKETFFINTHFNGETNKFLAEEIIKVLDPP